METKWSNMSCRRVLLTGFTLCIVLVTTPCSGIDIHADSEVLIQNGTTGTLRCSFRSNEVVSSTTSVTWTFQSNQPDNLFYKTPYTALYSRQETKKMYPECNSDESLPTFKTSLKEHLRETAIRNWPL
nr:myelin protein zero-like protein 1 [Pseudochaenichthys georgianus]